MLPPPQKVELHLPRAEWGGRSDSLSNNEVGKGKTITLQYRKLADTALTKGGTSSSPRAVACGNQVLSDMMGRGGHVASVIFFRATCNLSLFTRMYMGQAKFERRFINYLTRTPQNYQGWSHQRRRDRETVRDQRRLREQEIMGKLVKSS